MKTFTITAFALVIVLLLAQFEVKDQAVIDTPKASATNKQQGSQAPRTNKVATDTTIATKNDNLPQPELQKQTEVVNLPAPTPAPTPAPAPVAALPATATDNKWTVDITVNGVAPDRLNEALALYKSMGLSEVGSAYLLGNFAQESPSAFTDPCLRYGDGGLALGFGQWHPARRADMPCTVLGQLQWAVDVEMPRDAKNNGYASLSNRLRTTNVADIQYGLKQWERYGHEGKRFLYGQMIYDNIK